LLLRLKGLKAVKERLKKPNEDDDQEHQWLKSNTKAKNNDDEQKQKLSAESISSPSLSN